MRRFFLLIAVAMTFLMASPAMAQEGSTARPDGFGIGLGHGSISSGLSGKIHSGGIAFQGVVGCGYGYSYRCGALGVSLDILKSMPVFVDADVVQLAWNIGGGPSVAIGRYLGIGAQFVAGLEFIFPSIPIDLVLEARPGVIFDTNWDRGLRYRDNYYGFLGGHIRIYL